MLNTRLLLIYLALAINIEGILSIHQYASLSNPMRRRQSSLQLYKIANQLESRSPQIPTSTQEYYKQYEQALQQLQKKGVAFQALPKSPVEDSHAASQATKYVLSHNFEDNLDKITNTPSGVNELSLAR